MDQVGSEEDERVTWLIERAARAILAKIALSHASPGSRKRNAAYAPDQPHSSHTDVRDAGPSAMRDAPRRDWTEIDEDLDESFPASDPPGGY